MKKRFLSFASAAIITLATINSSFIITRASGTPYPSGIEVSAAAEYDNTWNWNNCGDHIELFRYSGKKNDVSIPEQINGLPVTALNASCFEYSKELVRSLHIPATVTELNGALGICRNLEAVDIDKDNKSFIFEDCAVYSADRTVLLRCVTSAEGEFTIPDTVIRLEKSAFAGCCKLKGINAGENNKYYSSIDGVLFDKYGEKLFQYPPGNENSSYSVPESVKEISAGAFEGANNLENLKIPYGVELIGSCAFACCGRLNDIVIPDSVVRIGEAAFRDCSCLSDIAFSPETFEVGKWAVAGTPWFESQPDGLVYTGSVLYKLKGSLPEDSRITVKEGTVGICSNALDNGLSENAQGDLNLISMTLPDSVRYIGEKAFYGCENLKSINLPDSIENIGEMAFADCQALEEIHIPTSLKSIQQGTFASCRSLTRAVLPENITNVGYGSFANCGSLKYFTVEYSYCMLDEPLESQNDTEPFNGTILGYTGSTAQSYAERKGYKFFSLGTNPDELIYTTPEFGNDGTWEWFNYGKFIMITGYLGDSEVLEIPDTINGIPVTEVSRYANIPNAEKIKTVKIPAGITKIGGLFDHLQNVSDIEIDKDNKSFSFENNVLYTAQKDSIIKCCTGLEGVFTIPDTVTSVDGMAFLNCSAMTVLNIHAAVKEIGNIFDGCSSLEAINVSKSNENYSSINGVFFDKNGNSLLRCPQKYPDKNFIIPASIQNVNYHAFQDCVELESIEFPDEMQYISNEAFKNCVMLDNVVLPQNVNVISSRAFENCSSLKNISFSDNVTYFGENVMQGTAWLESQADGPVYCGSVFCQIKGKSPDLTEIVVKDGTKCIAEYAFSFEKETDSDYKEHENTFLRSVTLPDSIESVCSNAFYGCSAMTDVNLPDGVKRQWNGTFSGCKSLKDIAVSGSARCINQNEFRDCDSLKNVVIPENIEYIDFSAFADCASLESVTILNPECIISGGPETICNEYIFPEDNDASIIVKYNGTICGYDGSRAEEYAKQNGYKFTSLGKAPSEYPLGDINENGIVDAVDASMILAYYARISTGEDGEFSAGQRFAADLDKDGYIDAVDASKILSYYSYASTETGTVMSIKEFITGINVFDGFEAEGRIKEIIAGPDGNVLVRCDNNGENVCYVFDTDSNRTVRTVPLADKKQEVIGMFSSGTIAASYPWNSENSYKLKMYPASGNEPYDVETGTSGYKYFHIDSTNDCIYWNDNTDNCFMKINEKGERSRYLSLSKYANVSSYKTENCVFAAEEPSESNESGLSFGLYSITDGKLITNVFDDDKDVFLTKENYTGVYSVGNDRDYVFKVADISGNDPVRTYKLSLEYSNWLKFAGCRNSDYLFAGCYGTFGTGNPMFVDVRNGTAAYADFKEADDLGIDGFCYLENSDKWIVAMSSPYSYSGGSILVSIDPDKLNYNIKLENVDIKEYKKNLPVEAGESFSEIRAEADKLEEEFGVRILVGNEVKNSESASSYSFASTETNDEYYVQCELENVRNLRKILSLYPEGFFSHFRSENGQCGLRIALVRELRSDEYSSFTAGGVAYTTGGWYDIAILSNRLSETDPALHHEIWHSVEYLISDKYGEPDEYEWKKLDPEGFEYSNSFDDYAENLGSDTTAPTLYNALENSSPQYDFPYFISDYSMITPYEDRATLIEQLFLREYDVSSGNMKSLTIDELKKYPHIKAKLDFLASWSKQEFGCVYWEEMLKKQE